MKKFWKKAAAAGAALLFTSALAMPFAACANDSEEDGKESVLFADMFSQNLVLVQNENEKWGYIDKTGAEAIACTYDDAKMFFNGLAPVKSGDKWGYLDEKGNMAIEAKFDTAGYFYDNKTAVVAENTASGKKYALIDKTGAYLTEAKFDALDAFIDTFSIYAGKIVETSASAVKIDGKYGMIDTQGKYVLDPVYTSVQGGTVNGGYVIERAKAGAGNETESNITDGSGKILLPEWYENIGNTFDTKFIPVEKGGKWGAVNASGNIVVPMEYDGIDGFINDRATYRDSGKYGVMDETGKKLTEAVYDNIETYGSLLGKCSAASARKGEKCGLLGKDGKELTEFVYKEVNLVGKNLYVCTDAEEKETLIDDTGKVLAEAGKYAEILPGDGNSKGLATTTGYLLIKNVEGKYGVLKADGTEAIAPQYEEIESCVNGMITVKKTGENGKTLYGVYTVENKEVIPFGKYDETEAPMYTDGYIVVEKNDLKGIADKEGNAFVEPKYKEIIGFNIVYLLLTDAFH